MKMCVFKEDVCTTPYGCSINALSCIFKPKPKYQILWTRQYPSFDKVVGHAIFYKGFCVAISNGKILTKLI